MAIWEAIDELADKSDYEAYTNSVSALFSALMLEKWRCRTSDIDDLCQSVLDDLSTVSDSSLVENVTRSVTGGYHLDQVTPRLRKARVEMEDTVRDLLKDYDLTHKQPCFDKVTDQFSIPDSMKELGIAVQDFKDAHSQLVMDKFR